MVEFHNVVINKNEKTTPTEINKTTNTKSWIIIEVAMIRPGEN